LDARSIFAINSLIDWLCLADVFKGGPSKYRINTPGTISDKNWSLRIPIALDDLLKDKLAKEMKSMINSSGRS